MFQDSHQSSNASDHTIFKPNEHFFLRLVTFQVDNELFQFPSILFPASDRFRELYPSILDENSTVLLTDCTKDHFEAFLTVILKPYHMFPGDHPCNNTPNLDVILPALQLANQWGFYQLSRVLTDQALCLIDSDVRKLLVLGREYKIIGWYRQGLETLVASDEDITLADAEIIGYPLALRVYHARGRIARALRRGTFEHEVDHMIVTSTVEDMFAEELESIRCSDAKVGDRPRSAQGDSPPLDSDFGETDTEVVMADALSELSEQLVDVEDWKEAEWKEDLKEEDLKEEDLKEEDLKEEDLKDENLKEADQKEDSKEEDLKEDLKEVSREDLKEDLKEKSREDSKEKVDTVPPDAQPEPSTSEIKIEVTTTEVKVTTDPPEVMRDVVRAVIDIGLRATPRVASKVPKHRTCTKGGKCHEQKRCLRCCQARAKEYQDLGKLPRAKTAYGQVLLDIIVSEKAGCKTSSREVVTKIPRSCSSQKVNCGEVYRCWTCFSRGASICFNQGEVI